MDKKVKVSQKLADEIGAYRTIIDIINTHNTDKYEWKEALIKDKRNDEISSNFPLLQKTRVHTIRAILENGYEIEAKQTPDEIIKRYYDNAVHFAESVNPSFSENDAKVDAVRFVLNTLDIKIKGVND